MSVLLLYLNSISITVSSLSSSSRRREPMRREIWGPRGKWVHKRCYEYATHGRSRVKRNFLRCCQCWRPKRLPTVTTSWIWNFCASSDYFRPPPHNTFTRGAETEVSSIGSLDTCERNSHWWSLEKTGTVPHPSVKRQNNFWVSTGFHWFSSFRKLGNRKPRNPALCTWL